MKKTKGIQLKNFSTKLGLWALSMVSASAISPISQAQARPPSEELVSAQIELEQSEGLPSYLALRSIWSLWDRVDPRLIEAALQLSAESDHLAPMERSYAVVLRAYARLRRGDVQAARALFRSQGYIEDFFVAGPFDNEGKTGFEEIFELDAQPGKPIIPGQAFSGKERPVRYRRVPKVFPYGFVDAGTLLRPKEQICAFFTTFIRVEEQRLATAWLGANGAYRFDVNGRTYLKQSAYRGFDFDRQSTTIRLESGVNRLQLKACGATSAPVFALRLADAQGQPDAALKTVASLELSHEAEATVERVIRENKSLPPHPKSLQGPLDLTVAIFESVTPASEDLLNAANYLMRTQGDDSVTHQARELIARALKQEPKSIEALLIAARLAEDRNQAREFILRAQLAAENQEGDFDSIKLLLAQARLARTGPSPLHAFPIYDQVLVQEPDQLEALQGRVELYNAAGLRRSALAALEAALERQPQSVRLLGMVAAQRKQLGLSLSATDAEERYSALRLDDTTFLNGRLELALARRNSSAAEHWLSRIQTTEPQALWTYKSAAKAHRRLGAVERAVADLEAARELAPEDIALLKALADDEGRAENYEAQLVLLEEVLRLRPQEADVRQYVDFIRPPVDAPDEQYALTPEEFLPLRFAPSDGQTRRTLRDLKVTTVYENGLSRTFRQVVFQPLTDSAAALGRQYAFSYQADRQRVRLKGAKVYRADGSVDEAIESGQAAANDPSIAMYTSARTFYVQFPRLEPGDVVELRYRIDDVTSRNEFADYFGEIASLQADTVLQNAEYVLITPKSRHISVDQQLKGLELEVSETEKNVIHRFRAAKVPALVSEPKMPPFSEVLGFVHVSTYKSWNDLGAWYWGLIKEQFDTDPETRELAQQITANAQTDQEKVEAVYGWVVKNTRYVALEFGIYGFKPRRCVQTVNRGWGDCKDKATVIVTLLRELGIEAYLVILRTQMRGAFPSDLPSLAPFDHAIAYIPSLDLYLDGTAQHTGTKELPVMDQGAVGLQILDGKAKLVTLPRNSRTPNRVQKLLDIKLAANGDAQMQLEVKAEGSSAPSYRSRYEAKATRLQRFSSDLGSRYPGLVIDKTSLKVGDLADIEASPVISLTAKVPSFARLDGAHMSIIVSPQLGLVSTYGSLSQRKLDLRLLGVAERQEKVRITLPLGVEVEAAPVTESFSSPFGYYDVSYVRQGDTVTVKSSFGFKVSRVSPQQYPAFRQFCLQVDQAFAHRLLLKRKN